MWEETRNPWRMNVKKHYRDFTKKKGIYDDKKHIIGSFKTEDGYTMMKKAIGKGSIPTVFFVASDSMAMGAMQHYTKQIFIYTNDVYVSIVSFMISIFQVS